jgi:ABC-type antimicrobial peptide transport system permease subunit
VVRLVLVEAIALLCAGLAAGVVLTLAAGRAAQSLLYGVEPNDLSSLAVSGAILAVIGLLASYLPARRAALLDPMTTLREE